MTLRETVRRLDQRQRWGLAAAVVVVIVLAIVLPLTLTGGGGSPPNRPGPTAIGTPPPSSTASPSETTRSRTTQQLLSDGVVNSQLVPRSGAMFGAWAGGGTTKVAAQETATADFESIVGRPLDIVQHYYKWDQAFPLTLERSAMQRGQLPLISWNGTDVADIVDGSQDSVIESHANAIKSLGQPVLLRWFWEMDGKRKADVVRSPEQYIAAWRYVHDKFDAMGVTNARWVWCPDAFAFDDGTAQQYYPGDNEVDWVCADGYSRKPQKSGQTFADVFRSFYQFGVEHGKPMMVGEFGVLNTSPGAQAAWLEQARSQIKQEFPEIKALVYWNSVKEDRDWRPQDEAAKQALAAFAADPYFNPLR